jgi:hypothetical protein
MLRDEVTEPPKENLTPSPTSPQPAAQNGRPTAGPARRFKRRELELAAGKLVLRGDGSIVQFGTDGTTTHTWATDDPEWAGHAIRFGLRPQPDTVAPHHGGTRGPRPAAG